MAIHLSGDRDSSQIIGALVSKSSTRDIAEYVEDPHNGKDRISELPDDIISTFLSPMEMKEAAKTSIVSKRWKNLWAFWSHLDFNHVILFPESDPDPECFDIGPNERSKYKKWVNQVVDLHYGPCIDTFRVRFWFDCIDAPHIDKWLRFALSKKVKNLELNLFTSSLTVYTIEFDNLKPSLLLRDTDISFLTSLHLGCINVSEDALENIMSRCCLLETLFVRNSYTLVRLKAGGLSCKLKHLTIKWCLNLEELEIDASNLVYFEYQGIKPCTNLVFKSIPVLVEAVLGGQFDHIRVSISEQISHIAAVISKLSINLKVYDISAGYLPTFCNLKQLRLVVDGFPEIDIIGITNLLVACPLLHEFELEVSWGYNLTWVKNEASELKGVEEVAPEDDNENAVLQYDFEMLEFVVFEPEDLELWQRERRSHPNLKVLRIDGFSGCNGDVNFTLLFLGFACNLETIICDTTRSSENPSQNYFIEVAKSRAVKLARFIPAKISVVIT